ncbi:MAG: pilus assembly protein CpaE [Cellulomonadaceae bacterium]
MISVDLAAALDVSGVRWRPVSGDRFAIRSAQLSGEVFTIADMAIETHEFDTGTVLGFNGTTEWALDSVAIEDALWLPYEHQLRALLGGAFRGLVRTTPGGDELFLVHVELPDGLKAIGAQDAEDAYALALLDLVHAATD